MAHTSQRRPKLGATAVDQQMLVHFRFARLDIDAVDDEPSSFTRCLARIAGLANEFSSVELLVAAEAGGSATADLYLRIGLGTAHEALNADPELDPTAMLIRRVVFDLAHFRPHLTDSTATSALVWAAATALTIAGAHASVRDELPQISAVGA